MSVDGRAKGSRFERTVARKFGGARTPLSGGAGGNDVSIPDSSVFADWAVECKVRKQLPGWLLNWLAQAEYARPIASQKRPCVVMKEDRGRVLFVAYLDDLVTWAEALADTGQGYKAKALIRQIRHSLDELEGIK